VIADCRAPSVPGGAREALLAEGLVSLVCAPMSRDEEPVGALYVADRHRTPFTDSDARLLSALAAQASIALANRTLYARLREHNELLEATFSVHHELTQASLTGVGVQGVVELLAQLVGHPIALTVDAGEVPVVRSVDAPAEEGEDGLHAVVSAGAERLGVLQVIGVQALAPLQRKAFEHGQTVLALELLRERTAREVEWRLSGELLDGLLECEGEPPAVLRRRAEHLRVDLAEPHRALAFALGDEVEAERLLARVRGLLARRAPGNAMHALSGRRGAWVVLALPPALEHDAAALADAVRGLDGGRWDGVRVGVGPLDQRLANSWRAATACVGFAERIGGRAGVTEYDELGPLRFVLETPDPRHAVAIASEALEQLVEHDRGGRSELLGTLRAYLETGGHQRETADRCHIATSTLKYRLAKIRDMLGRDPGEPEARFELTLAFKLRDLLAATGAEPEDARVPADSAD
jgi:sugar diacid utilization regulator